MTMKLRTLNFSNAAPEKHAPKVVPMDANENDAKLEGIAE